MNNWKKKEKDPLDPQTVFTINHSELKGVTQCKEHVWVDLNEKEKRCINCPTVIIVK